MKLVVEKGKKYNLKSYKVPVMNSVRPAHTPASSPSSSIDCCSIRQIYATLIMLQFFISL